MNTPIDTSIDKATVHNPTRAECLDNDLGTTVVCDIYEHLQVDDEWSVWNPRGFDWWGHNHMQRIWSSPGFRDLGFTIYHVCAETDILRNVPYTDKIEELLAIINASSTLGSYIYLPEELRIVMHSSMYIHDETASWSGRFLAESAILQPIMAELIAPIIAVALGRKLDESGHPVNGIRNEPDEMLGVLDKLYKPRGQGDSAWDGSDEFEEVAIYLNSGNSYANGDPTGLSAEFPFGTDETSLLRVDTREPHTIIGSGLSLRLHLPLQQTKHEASILAGHLNRLERKGGVMSHMLGSWTVHPDDVSRPVYTSFIPSILYQENLLKNLVIRMLLRARDVAGLLADTDGEGNVIEVVSRRLQAL